MSGKLAVSFLRPGVHEIRQPGQADWLPVEDVKHTAVGTVLTAGGREFLTGRTVHWPVRVAEASS